MCVCACVCVYVCEMKAGFVVEQHSRKCTLSTQLKALHWNNGVELSTFFETIPSFFFFFAFHSGNHSLRLRVIFYMSEI